MRLKLAIDVTSVVSYWSRFDTLLSGFDPVVIVLGDINEYTFVRSPWLGPRFASLRPRVLAFLPAQEINLRENEISRQIVEAAIDVHRTLGGLGLLECDYEEALVWELQRGGLDVQRQVVLPIPYKSHTLGSPLRIDLIVGAMVTVECKAVAQYDDNFAAQVLTYLRLTKLKLGLVAKFGERVVKDGIHRVVNGF